MASSALIACLINVDDHPQLEALFERLRRPRAVRDKRLVEYLNEICEKFGPVQFFPPDRNRIPRLLPDIEELEKLRDIEQNSDLWHENRKRIGASEAACALGVERYQCRVLLLLIKLGVIRLPQQYRLPFDQGHFMEDANTKFFDAIMRTHFNVPDAHGKPVGILVDNELCVTHSSVDYLPTGSSRPSNPLFESVLKDVPPEATLNDFFVECKVYDRNQLHNAVSNSYPVQMHQQNMTLRTQPWAEFRARKYMFLSVMKPPYDDSKRIDTRQLRSCTLKKGKQFKQKIYYLPYDEKFEAFYKDRINEFMTAVDNEDMDIEDLDEPFDLKPWPKPKLKPLAIFGMGSLKQDVTIIWEGDCDWRTPKIEPAEAIETDPLLKWILTPPKHNQPYEMPPYTITMIEVCNHDYLLTKHLSDFEHVDPAPTDIFKYYSGEKERPKHVIKIIQRCKRDDIVFIWTIDEALVDIEEREIILSQYTNIPRADFLRGRFSEIDISTTEAKVHPILIWLLDMRKRGLVHSVDIHNSNYLPFMRDATLYDMPLGFEFDSYKKTETQLLHSWNLLIR